MTIDDIKTDDYSLDLLCNSLNAMGGLHRKDETLSKHLLQAQGAINKLREERLMRKPHGRLIDADALIKSLEVNPVECPGCPEPEYLEEFIELLREAQTIIPAEGE